MGIGSQRLKNILPWFWVTTIVIIVVLLVLRFFDPITLGRIHTEHTYFRVPTDAATNGQLYSDRWGSGNWWITGLYVLLWVVPFSAMFMIANTTSKQRGAPLYFHMITTMLLLLAITSLLIYYIVLWVNANGDPLTSSLNIANDYRYCCIDAFRAVDVSCPNHASATPCDYIVPPLMESELRVNGDFLVRFWFTLALFLLFILDLVMTFLINTYIRDWDKTLMSSDATDDMLGEPLIGNSIYSTTATATTTIPIKGRIAPMRQKVKLRLL